MRVSFHTFPDGWPYSFAGWRRYRREKAKYDWSRGLLRGMQRQGCQVSIAKPGEVDLQADIAVIWSWKKWRVAIGEQMLAAGRHVLVIERGFIPPRHEWCSLALDGSNGRGKFPPCADNGERWERHFQHQLRPWRHDDDGYALIIGQGQGDGAMHGADFIAWAQEQTNRLRSAGCENIVYRPNPERPTPCPDGASLSTGSLADDFAGADRVVCFNSTASIASVLAGIPTVITDHGSVAWPMATHTGKRRWCGRIEPHGAMILLGGNDRSTSSRAASHGGTCAAYLKADHAMVRANIRQVRNR